MEERVGGWAQTWFSRGRKWGALEGYGANRLGHPRERRCLMNGCSQVLFEWRLRGSCLWAWAYLEPGNWSLGVGGDDFERQGKPKRNSIF